MDCKEQVRQAKNAAAQWHAKHPIVGVGELRVDLMVDDLTHSITDLLARAEAAEKRLEMSRAELEAARKAQLENLSRAEAAEARAEKAEHDMKRIVNRSSYPCEYCTKEKCFATDMKRQCYDFVWDSGQKEE